MLAFYVEGVLGAEEMGGDARGRCEGEIRGGGSGGGSGLST